MQITPKRTASVLPALFCWLAGCGGGGSGTSVPSAPPPALPPVAKAEAFRFLAQSTMGATEAEATRLIALGDSSNAYSRWIDAELAKPASLLLPAIEAAYPNPVPVGLQHRLAQCAARREVVRQRAERQRPAAPARGLGAVADLRGVAGGRAAEPAECHRRFLRHARAQCVRRFSQAAGGRDAASGHGRVPVDARQPEGRGRHQPAPRRELRARSDAADVHRPGGVEPRWHA